MERSWQVATVLEMMLIKKQVEKYREFAIVVLGFVVMYTHVDWARRAPSARGRSASTA